MTTGFSADSAYAIAYLDGLLAPGVHDDAMRRASSAAWASARRGKG